jgi:hypothetical protein
MWEQPNIEEVNKEAFFLIAELAGEGYSEVHIEFSGSGDDGSIQATTFFRDGQSLSDDQPLQEKIEEWAYRLLDTTNVDWVNNEGGYGSINIDLEERGYKFTVHKNVEESYIAAEGGETFGDKGGDGDPGPEEAANGARV